MDYARSLLKLFSRVDVGQKDVSPLMDHVLSIKELVKYFFSATLRASVSTDHHPSIQNLSLPRKIKFIIILIMVMIIMIIIIIIIIIIIMETLLSFSMYNCKSRYVYLQLTIGCLTLNY